MVTTSEPLTKPPKSITRRIGLSTRLCDSLHQIELTSVKVTAKLRSSCQAVSRGSSFDSLSLLGGSPAVAAGVVVVYV